MTAIICHLERNPPCSYYFLLETLVLLWHMMVTVDKCEEARYPSSPAPTHLPTHQGLVCQKENISL